MGRKIDWPSLEGTDYFGTKLVKYLGRAKNGHAVCKWECKYCSKLFTAHAGDIRSGHTESDGCYKKAINTTHGHSAVGRVSHTYRVWCMIIQRVLNPNHVDFHNYGGRKIGIHPSFMTFEGFLAYVGVIPDWAEIDRIDNDGDYAPGNIRLVTHRQNQRNKRDTTYATVDGKSVSVAEMAVPFGLTVERAGQRFKYGWTLADTLVTTPNMPRGSHDCDPEHDEVDWALTTKFREEEEKELALMRINEERFGYVEEF
jgi:hypothetical protein